MCVQRFTQQFSKQNIATMASGGQGPSFRFYFHAQLLTGSQRILVEMLVNTAAGSIGITLKSNAQADAVTKFSSLLTQALNSF